jgi:glycosyltransferase involved in cell wall biosynthesis
LKFASYLRNHGWESMILTVHPRAHEVTSPDQLNEIPEGMVVKRAFAFDTARQLAVRGRYPDWLAIPDRYWSWLFGGVWDGLGMIRREHAAAIWSTYPIATAHLIGAVLHRITRLPWIADFRDSMTEDAYPSGRLRWHAYRRIERYAAEHAIRCVFTTEGARAMYAARYPQVPVERWVVIPNGFDEENFANAETSVERRPPGNLPIQLVHSGTLYPSERDPSQFFEAIRRLKTAGAISANRLRIILRATGHDAMYRVKLAELGIDDIVELHGTVPYREALTEMLTADGLLLFQAANSNHQVPAKVYEYLRAGRPILALTDPAGDTAGVLRDANVGVVVRLDDTGAIAASLTRFIDGVSAGSEVGATPEQAARFSRRYGTARLAELLDTAVA